MKKAFFTYLITFTLLTVLTLFCAAESLPLNEKTTVTVGKNETLEYDIIIEEKGFFYLDMFTKSIPQNLRFSYSLKSGDEVIFSYSLSSREDNIKDFGEGLIPGTYTLTINNKTIVPVDFSLETKFTATDYCETVSNSSFENAIPIEFGKDYYGSASINTKEDYYCFTILEDGYVEIEAEGWVSFTVCDSEYNELCSGSGSSQNEDPRTLTSGLLPGKLYYLKVDYAGSERGFGDVAYRFNIKPVEDTIENLETECNNSPETAIRIEPDTWYSGYLFGETDVDYYYIDFAYSDLVEFKLEKDEKKAVMVHFWGESTDEPENKENPIVGEKATSKVEVKIRPANNGKYYIKIISHPFDDLQNVFYKFRIKGEVLDYMIHPETKKIVLKEDYYKESEQNTNDTDDSAVTENSPKEPDESILQFDDISESSWYHDDILEARKLGLIEGIDKNSYAPKSTITVAQAITMAVRFHKDKNGIDFAFNRYSGDNWYDSYLIYAKNAGLIGEDDFAPEQLNQSATRAQMAYIFASVLPDADSDLYKDIPDVDDSTPHADSIRKLYTFGVLKGNDEKGTFTPDAFISRAEAAVIILRASKV